MHDETEGVTVVYEGEVIAWAEDGRFLVAGEQSAVDRFVAELQPRRSLRVSDLRPAADALAVLTSVLGMTQAAGSLVQVDRAQWAALQAQGVPDAAGAFLPTLRNAAGGYTHNLRLRPVSGLQTAQFQMLVIYAAIRLAIEEVVAVVEEVAADVDDLKRLAEAEQIGDLSGLYRVLTNARVKADRTGRVDGVDWDAIAPHEVTAQQAADRIRVLLHRRIADLPLDGDFGERLDATTRLLSDEFFSRNLRLLILAEQCRMLYRSLKLDRIRTVEPLALNDETTAARDLLEENAAADQRLVEELRDAVKRLGATSGLDGFRIFSRSELPAAAKQLSEQVEHFAGIRLQQIDSWSPGPAPDLGDAWTELGRRAESAFVGARQAVGGWLQDLGSSLAKEPEQAVAEPVDAQEATRALSEGVALDDVTAEGPVRSGRHRRR